MWKTFVLGAAIIIYFSVVWILASLRAVWWVQFPILIVLALYCGSFIQYWRDLGFAEFEKDVRDSFTRSTGGRQKSRQYWQGIDLYWRTFGLAFFAMSLGQMYANFKTDWFVRVEKPVCTKDASPGFNATKRCERCQGWGAIAEKRCNDPKCHLGSIPCDSCGGYGSYPDQSQCSECRGVRYFKCDKCIRQTCPVCDGERVIRA